MNALSKAITGHCRDVAKAAEASLKHFEAEAIHRLRVSLKQLRALFNLLIFSVPELLNEGDWKAARKIFKQAGRVREKQLLRERIRSLSAADREPQRRVIEFLEEGESLAQRKFKHHYSSKGEKELKLLRKKMLYAAGKITPQQLELYFDELLMRINFVRAKKIPGENDLHRLRTLLKELKYNRPLAEQMLHVKTEGSLNSNVLDAWEELIGKWHDEVIFLQRGEKLMKDMHAEGGTREVIEEMEDLSARNSEILLRELAQRFPPGTDGQLRRSPSNDKPPH